MNLHLQSIVKRSAQSLTLTYMALLCVFAAGCAASGSTVNNGSDDDLIEIQEQIETLEEASAEDEPEFADEITLEEEAAAEEEAASEEEPAFEEEEAEVEDEPEDEILTEDEIADETAVEEDAEPEFDPELDEEPVNACPADANPLSLWKLTSEEFHFSSAGEVYRGKIETRCQTDGFLIAGRKDMKVNVILRPWTPIVQLNGHLVVADAATASKRRAGTTYFDGVADAKDNTVSFTFTLPYTGEFLITVSGKNYASIGNYELAAKCEANCGKKFTRFPIALLHGMGGFDKALGLLDYFNGVPNDLRDQGYDVYVTQVAMFNDSDYRADELEKQLMQILTSTGARKINLIAHSQGGIDSRIFISRMKHGGDVSVLCTVATPHRGTIVGDIILGNVQGISREAIAGLIDAIAGLMGASESDVVNAIGAVSVEKMETVFNPSHPDDPRVQYWSYTGVSCRLFDGDCRDAHGREWVNPALSLTYGFIKDADPGIGAGDNDGMVPVNSAQWGEFMKLVNADHADEIGQLKTGDFDHKGMYREIAQKMFDRNF